MTEAELFNIAGRAPTELERRVNCIHERADTLHEPSAAFFDLPWPWPKSAPAELEVLRFIANSALEHNALVKRIVEQHKTHDEVPGFDSEAHRSFMRSLG